MIFLECFWGLQNVKTGILDLSAFIAILLQKNELQKLQKDFCVDVNVDTRTGRITLHGLMEDVMDASEKVHNIIRKAEAIQQDKHTAEMMADMVEWCFLDASTVPSKLEKYPANINLQLEKALMNQESKTSFCDDQGNRYIVDLTSYEEYPEGDVTDVVKVLRKSKITGEFIYEFHVYFLSHLVWWVMGITIA